MHIKSAEGTLEITDQGPREHALVPCLDAPKGSRIDNALQFDELA